ncbi:MAG: hypothetical protein GOMPHAMPRED_002587 [Gomphillus americanus]|uniref:C2H2-type domain-containing protein n=1 Tax=Gomphillus americanus TaxID=1940652 RepID=A0A8H3IQR7_9LECA|nr:MAG: hypothetical protein GOMPHAMPRED_002587 [Gomphillus americanus]
MESTNPRRRQLNIAPPSLFSTTAHKGFTFDARSSPKLTERDPILSISTLLGRSATSAEDLEIALTANNNRIASILGAVDRSFSSLESLSKDSQETILVDPEPAPVPLFMIDAINQHDFKDAMEIDYPTPRRKHHASDSGIGSTETSEASVVDKTVSAPSSHNQSRINGISSVIPPSGSITQQVLSEYACRQIQKHIILPIIRDEKLKPFHSLVHGLPYRVARKEITCLRDLEKVILWLAPKWSTSRKSFLLFCETSIQCIHTTVEYLSGGDLRRPSDRPYTNGYFLDLVEQVRQYAAIMAAERAKAQSEKKDETTTENSKITLVGGLSQTGRPAELVRTVDGKSVSLRTGDEVNMEEYKTGIKRSFDEDYEDDLERSMARRKKNAVRIDQLCKECGKAFKRPCDLTKHEKTHSRPWKCDEVGCKYHTYGWPTEKERDRHMNDKHSAAPKMYKCQYSPCPYESKRESNCKQHMEKAHGYVYVRAKNNGKVRAPSTIGAPTTPQMSTPGSHTFSAPTPDFSDAQSINESIDDNTWRYLQEATNFGEIFGPAGPDFSFAESPLLYNEAGPSNSHRPSYDSAVTAVEEDSIFGTDFDWSNVNLDFVNFNAQIPTPALSHQTGFSSAPSVNYSPPSTCLSPHAQADAMFYSPTSHAQHNFHDEGYSELAQEYRPMHDFNLYSNATPAALSPGVEMFGELPSFEKTSQVIDTQMTFFDNIM